jgi:DNA-binding LytR/AlgR family response regulator
MKINCLIIDDEPSSQTVLKKFVADVEFLELVGVCNNAIEALQILNQNQGVDLLFLDINMPKISGLTFYKSLQHPPNVIFTTAYSGYAVDGFEVNAIDYLLKPFSFERFFTAVTKVLEKQMPNGSRTENDYFIMVKSNKILHKINTNDILYIEAFGDYVKVYLDDNYIMTNATFTSVFESLPQHIFIRTHKSFAINFKYMNSIIGNQINIKNFKIPIGQKYKTELLEFINQSKS